MQGTIKWFSKSKGYGFLVPDAGGSDVFLHISAIEKSGMTSVKDGQKVSYELAPDRDGRMCAADLRAA